MSEEALRKSAIEQAALVRSGELSARELVEASLAAIDRLNPELNAFITMCGERALAEAEAIEPGDERPLAGVPIAIKDILALTEGVRTTFGSAVTGDWIPPIDSNVVQRLRGAGAIVVGKTNVPELGILPVTEPHRFGPTRNPWDTSRTPGGSSGGSAAAVASGMLALAHANDGGGSTRIPAACCGLVGLKPTRGRISVAPIPNDTLGLATDGVVSWTVAETALSLDLLSGYEPGDPFPLPSPRDGFVAAVEREPGMLRVGFSTRAPNDAPVDPEHAAAVERTAELLESLGHRVEEAQIEFDAGPFMENFLRLWIADVGAHARSLAALGGGQLDREQLEPLTRQMAEQADGIAAVDLISSIEYLRLAARVGLGFFTDHDVLVTPVLAQPPLEIGALDPEEGEEPIAMLVKSSNFVPFTPPANVTGQPAISLPLAQSESGLPIGVQFIGGHGGDATLLSLAAQLEQAWPWSDRRPPVGAAA
jgi:amidase